MSKHLREATQMDHFSQLPNPAVHHILSFLPSDTAWLTCVLSKTWNNFWSTYPYLEISKNYARYLRENHPSCSVDNSQFYGVRGESQTQQKEAFLNLIDGYLERRLQGQVVNGNIHRLRMSINFPDLKLLTPLMDRWVGIAAERNVVELDLDVVNFFSEMGHGYKVPQSVLVSNSLTCLALSRCVLGERLDMKLPNLRKLSFVKVRILDENMCQNFVAICPLIEHLQLQICYGLTTLLLISSLTQLKHVMVSNCHGLSTYHIEAPNLDTFIIVNHNDSCGIHWPAICTTLRVFTLSGVRITSEQFQSLMSKLPGVEDLEILHSHGLERIKISSTNLKSLRMEWCSKLLAAEILTPNLLKYHFLYDHYDRDDLLSRWDNLKHFLVQSSLSEDMKLVLFREGRTMIIHERLSEISTSALVYLKSKDFSFTICTSSRSYADLVDLLFRFRPSTLSVVCSSLKPVEMISEKLTDSNWIHPRTNWQVRFVGFEINTLLDEESLMNSAWKFFLKAHSVGPYQSTTFMLRWKGVREIASMN